MVIIEVGRVGLEVHALNEELTEGISAFAQVMGGMIEREKDECQFSEKKRG